MSLFNETKSDKSSKRDSKFVRLMNDIPIVVQILQKDSVSRFQHWITTSDGKKLAVRCSGFLSCPICARNAALGNDKDNPKYVPANRRYMVNVIDLTPVKKSINTGEIFVATKTTDGSLKFPEADSAGNPLVDVPVEPWGAVKILEGGPTLFQKLQARANITYDSNGAVRDARSYPVQIVRIGEGRSTDYIVDALTGSSVTIDPDKYADDLIDVNVLGFNSEEIQAMVDGVTLKDILAARKTLSPQISIADIDEIPF